MVGGCGVEPSKPEAQKTEAGVTQNSQSAATIDIAPNSPADTVRVFYKNLHDGKFRDAIFLTNLRPALEGLTDAEIKDLQVDFEALAQQVPAEIQINGEIISGDKAAVTANLPDEKTNKMKTQEITLRRENDVWIVKIVDAAAETKIKKEGKNYFFALRIETHHEEAKEMMERIARAEMVHAIQNQGVYADLQTLVSGSLLSAELLNENVAGYNYKIFLSADKTNYSATAEPVLYGKSGKLSFLAEVADGKDKGIKTADNGGRTLKIR